MVEMAKRVNTKEIELWDGFEVTADLKLSKDVDFIADLTDAINGNDVRAMITMYMALIGGQAVYDKIKQHIIDSTGEFSLDSMATIMKKIDEAVFPKAGNRAMRRSYKTIQL